MADPPAAPVARVRVRVSAGAGRAEIVGRLGERWKVRVAATAERGRANEALLDLLARTLAVSRGRVRLVAGAAARDKVIEIAGMTAGDVDRLLEGRQRKGDP